MGTHAHEDSSSWGLMLMRTPPHGDSCSLGLMLMGTHAHGQIKIHNYVSFCVFFIVVSYILCCNR